MIILVADDDRLIRFMMKSMLSEILTSNYTILEAANGKEMVELCKNRQPDIVFADIKMPYMNGIDAIEACKKYSEDTEFVIISGYSEFSFAQKALKLRVQDYLLKPVEEEQLRHVVERIQRKIAGNKNELNSRFQLKLLNTFNYFSTVGNEEEYEEEQFGDGLQYEVIGMRSRCPKPKQGLQTGFLKEIIQGVDELGSRLVKSGSYYSLLYSPEGIPYFVFCTTGQGRDEVLDYVKKISLKYKNDSELLYFLHFNAQSMKDVYFECERLDNSQGLVMNYPNGTLIENEQICITEEGREVLKSTYYLLEAWERADSVSYKEILNRMYRSYKDVETGLNLTCISRYCGLIMQQEINGGSYKEFCRSFIDISESMYGNVESTAGDVVAQVKEYVEKNYMNDIGIGQIAELFDITPNYLSTVFHQKAGCKFVDYLTSVRIANARRLLIQNPTAAVKDIAVMVGYSSPRYFAALFQKVAGMKPSTYRKDNIG